ncbi:TfoX/Sxy family protein [Aquabacterium commune]|uniref:TfoX/Sxy family protein n=1 Tax=Aquabacterium commune TaxID=70586 RepID=UPI00105E9755|nr:TfoX/Sxy family protein [Aquabacterium commune]
MATNPSSARRAFADHVVDLLRGMGAVRAKPMFGGHGLYLDGVMFALLADGRCFIKVDAETLPVFEAERCLPFVFEAKGRRVALMYHEAPLEALDQPDVAVRWARLGVGAAHPGAVPVGLAEPVVGAGGGAQWPVLAAGGRAGQAQFADGARRRAKPSALSPLVLRDVTRSAAAPGP